MILSDATWPSDRNTGGIYVHVPFCMSRCHYCAFVTYPYTPDLEETFTNSVIQEICLWSNAAGDDMIPKNICIESLYFGGGTPSLLSPDCISRIINECVRRFHTVSSPEVTVEFNPATATRRSIDDFLRAGVNRVSLGIQSLNDYDLQRMGRIHTSSEALSSFWDLRAVGFDNVSVDLLAGFPGQRLESFTTSLNRVIALEPEHLSVYLFELKTGTRISSLLSQGLESPPDDDLAADMYDYACFKTQEAGYEHYEISNFCLTGKSCLHNLGYWEDRLYFGLGPGAHGMTGRHRYSNLEDFEKYGQSVRTGKLPIGLLTELDPMTRFKDALIMGCRLVRGLNIRRLGKRYGVDAISFVNETIGDLNQAGLFSIQDDMLLLTPKGRLLSNHIFCRWV